MGGDVYGLDYYVAKTKALADMGADSICIKDMAGLIAPYDAYALVKAIKEAVSVPIHLHSHFTSGMAQMSQLKAIEAGVDIVDTCMTPYAFRTSHPAIEPLVMTLLGTNRDTGFDIEALARIDQIIEKQIVPKYRHLLNDTKVSIVDINVLLHQTPGGMLSNLVNQLREMGALDRLDEVFEMLPKVRRDLGQVPLVTPTSQIVGIQAVNNVLFGDDKEPYKMITNQVKDLCYGLYGKTPVPVSDELRAKALKGYPRGQTSIDVRPGEVLAPELDQARKDTEGLARCDEDILIYALYPTTGRQFLRWKYGLDEVPDEVRPKTLEQIQAEQERKRAAASGSGPSTDSSAGSSTGRPDRPAPMPEDLPGLRRFDVFVEGEYFEVQVAADRAMRVSGPASVRPSTTAAPARPSAQSAASKQASGAALAATTATKGTTSSGGPAKSTKPSKSAPSDGTPVTAPMPGLVISVEKNEGDSVQEGEPVLMLEAMKMQNALPAPIDGTIVSVLVEAGQKVDRDDVLCVIK